MGGDRSSEVTVGGGSTVVKYPPNKDTLSLIGVYVVVFFCVEDLQLSQPIGVMLSVVTKHTFTGQG